MSDTASNRFSIGSVSTVSGGSPSPTSHHTKSHHSVPRTSHHSSHATSHHSVPRTSHHSSHATSHPAHHTTFRQTVISVPPSPTPTSHHSAPPSLIHSVGQHSHVASMKPSHPPSIGAGTLSHSSSTGYRGYFGTTTRPPVLGTQHPGQQQQNVSQLPAGAQQTLRRITYFRTAPRCAPVYCGYPYPSPYCPPAVCGPYYAGCGYTYQQPATSYYVMESTAPLICNPGQNQNQGRKVSDNSAQTGEGSHERNSYELKNYGEVLTKDRDKEATGKQEIMKRYLDSVKHKRDKHHHQGHKHRHKDKEGEKTRHKDKSKTEKKNESDESTEKTEAGDKEEKTEKNEKSILKKLWPW